MPTPKMSLRIDLDWMCSGAFKDAASKFKSILIFSSDALRNSQNFKPINMNGLIWIRSEDDWVKWTWLS